MLVQFCHQYCTLPRSSDGEKTNLPRDITAQSSQSLMKGGGWHFMTSLIYRQVQQCENSLIETIFSPSRVLAATGNQELPAILLCYAGWVLKPTYGGHIWTCWESIKFWNTSSAHLADFAVVYFFGRPAKKASHLGSHLCKCQDLATWPNWHRLLHCMRAK
jgi:hypothetical protein